VAAYSALACNATCGKNPRRRENTRMTFSRGLCCIYQVIAMATSDVRAEAIDDWFSKLSTFRKDAASRNAET